MNQSPEALGFPRKVEPLSGTKPVSKVYLALHWSHLLELEASIPLAGSTDAAKNDLPVAPAKKHWTTYIGQAAGHPAAFVIVIAYALLWLTFDRTTFDWNAIATLAVWIMTLFIQRTNRRDSLALHAKLDELLRVDQQARSELVRLDEQEPEAIERHRSAEVHNAAER